jgi:hypothetical protein
MEKQKTKCENRIVFIKNPVRTAGGKNIGGRIIKQQFGICAGVNEQKRNTYHIRIMDDMNVNPYRSIVVSDKDIVFLPSKIVFNADEYKAVKNKWVD